MKSFNLVIIVFSVITVSLYIFLNIFNETNCICEKQFAIIQRKEWDSDTTINAAECFSYNEELNEVLQYIIIHHSAFTGDYGVKNILNYQKSNGYSDIAYHFLISSDGKVYEGRKIYLIGAHAGETIEANRLADSIRCRLAENNIVDALKLDPDYGSIGICLEGNFEEQKPSHCQINSLRKLLNYLLKEYGIEKWNIILHNEVREYLILKRKLHPVKEETVCPGKQGVITIKELLKSIK